MKLLQPKYRIKKIEEFEITKIIENNYKIIIFDLNNTVIDYYTDTIPNGTKEYILKLKELGIKVYIISNSFDNKMIKNVANKLDVSYINKAFKPFPFAVKKVLKKENITNNNALVIGDHIITDILVANICKIDSVLVLPLNKNEKFHSKIARKFENLLLK